MSDNEQENENRETVAEILEEMRGMGNYQRYSVDHVRALANRIDAAWKRERAKVEADALEVGGIVEAARTAEKSSAVGNAAAMREALKDVLEKIDRWRTDGVMEHWQYSQLFDIADSALSAPARNCDIYKNKKDAEAAFISEECKHPCGNCTINDEYGCALVH